MHVGDLGPCSTARVRLAAAASPYGLTVGSLRAEARRGNLTIWRVAGKDWTSQAEIERMFDRCRVKAEGQDCGSEPLAEKAAARNQRFGSSETEDVSLALASARKLRNVSPPTSSPSTRRNVANAA